MFLRIPDLYDEVAIHASSSDEITLSSIVTIRSLQISGGRLILLGSGQLTVTEYYIQSSETLNIYGILLVKSFTWSGRYIYGAPQGRVSTFYGQITVSDKMVIQKGSYGQKYLYDVDVYSEKNLTVEQTMEYSSSLTCVNCVITNAKNSVFFLPGVSLYAGSSINQRHALSNFRQGLINYGSVVMANQRSVSWRWDIRNYGNMTLVCIYYPNTCTISVYNSVLFNVNVGTLTLYSTSLYFSGGSHLLSGEGRLFIYGVPGVDPLDYDIITGYRQPWLYEKYIYHLYDNHTYSPKIWDTYRSVDIEFQSLNHMDVLVSELRTYGRVQLGLYSWQHSRFIVTSCLYMSPESEIRLGNFGSSPSYSNNTFVVAENATEATFGDISINSPGYELQILPQAVNVTMKRVAVVGRLILSSSSVTITHELVIGPSGRLHTKTSSTAWIQSTRFQRFQAGGPAVLENAKITVSDRFLWKQSHIRGSNAILHIRGLGEISGDLSKTLDGVDLVIGAPPEICPKSGVIAEYFQYRVPTVTTPVMNSIYSFYYPGGRTSNGMLPQQFDNTSSAPSYSTVESGISSTTAYYGTAPLVFNNDNPSIIDEESPLSFTYNYAVRFFTFLKIDTSGKYKFYFITYHGQVRLWIDDEIRFTGRSYTSFMVEQETEDIHLIAGYHRLRVDNIVTSSVWNSRKSILYVLYEGPGVVKQSLPEAKQFFCKVNDTSGLNDYAANNPRALGRVSVGGEGLVVSKNLASVTVEKSGKLDFVSNSVWYSSGNSSTVFYNYGVISKTGVIGSATVCGKYVNRGGKLIHSSGNIDFKHPTSFGCSLVFWNNPSGGLWNDRFNWDPPRVPDETDLVYITLTGSPTVVISGTIEARANSLIVGGSDSSPHLQIEMFGKLNISDRMDVYSDTLTVIGIAEIGRFTWSGKTISSSSAHIGTIVVRQKFNIVKGSLESKHQYLNGVHIINKGNLTVDESSYHYDLVIQCSFCKLSNLGFMLTVPMRLDTSGEQSELENNGTLVVEMKSRSESWYWDITNNGKFILYRSYQGGGYDLSFYGRMNNKATLVSYGVDLYMYGSSSKKNFMGTMVMYGIPSWNSQTNTQAYGNWNDHSKELYQTPIVWDVRYQVNVHFSIKNSYGYTFDSYTTYGRIYTTVQYDTEPNVNDSPALLIEKQLVISRDSTFYAHSTSYSPRIAFTEGAFVTVDRLHLVGGWIMNITGVTFSSARYLGIESGGQLVSSNSVDTIQLNGSVLVHQKAVLSVSHTDVTINGNISLAGTLEINNSTVSVMGEFLWTDGTLKGTNGSLNIHGTGTVSSDYGKTVDGILIKLESDNKNIDYTGVAAEYFQYRVATDVTPEMNYINDYYYPGGAVSSGYLPQEFDNLTYAPNVVRLEPSLTRFPTVWGNGPVKYLTSGYGVDTSSPASFTYNYAVRYLAFLYVPFGGNYRFYFSSGQGRVRLWIDDQKLFEGKSYSGYFDEQATSYYNLTSGYRKLRVDIYVRSSYWDTYGSMVIVKLEGPGIPKQLLSSQNLTYAYHNGSSRVYANQHFPAKSHNTVMTLAGDGLIVAKSGSIIIITSSGILQILDDLIYYSHPSFGTTARIINAGVINKTGDAGMATFYAVYDNEGGQLIETAGSIEFLDAEKNSGVVLWNNPDGGSFLDPGNWVPPRVPGSTDIVYVTLPGTYKFVVTSAAPLTVRSLVLGASNSKPDVLIEHFTSLVVTHRLDIHTDQVELQGSILAGHITWSGFHIQSTASVSKSVITAQQTLVIFRGEYQHKQLRNIEVVNQGNMTIDQTMINEWIYCYGCRLVNERRGHIHADCCNLYGSTNEVSPDPDGFVYGLINYGLFAQVWTTTRTSIRWNWHVKNYGRMLFLNTYHNSVDIWINGVIINNGSIESYMASLNFNPVTLTTSNGSWSIYSTPARQYGLPSPSWVLGGYDAGLKYDQFIQDTYYNSTPDVYRPGDLWTCCSVFLRFLNVHSLRFHTLNTYGWVSVSFPSSSYGGRVYFDGTLDLSENTVLTTSDSSSAGNNTITCGSGLRARFGRLTYLSSGWTLVVEENATISATGDVFALLNSNVNISKGPDIVLDGQLIIHDSARLNVDSRRIVVKDGVYVASTVNLRKSQIVSEGRTRWNKGKIAGPSGHVIAEGGLDIYGRYSKILNNASLTLKSKERNTYAGVIAEYFQYRVSTHSTPQLRSIYGYYDEGCPSCNNRVPQAFDDPSTVANVVRIETTLNRKPRLYGHAPLVFDQSRSDYTYDWSSAESFTYNYAVRFSTFIRIWYPGIHTFYFLTGRDEIRLWIDGNVTFTGQKYTDLLEEQSTSIYLHEGYHHVRIDNIQTSSHWYFERNLLIVSYSSACIPKQPLTSDNLYYKIMISGTEKYASTALRVLDESSVCQSMDSLNDLRSYDFGVSYGTVRDNGRFLSINGSAIFVETTGVLDIQSDISWTYDSSQGDRTYLRVRGAVGKSDGSATVSLGCLFNDTGGCRKIEKGSLNLGTAGGKNIS